MEKRILSWFSCGAASAVAAKLAIDKYGDKVEVVYCNTLAYEHPDNKRFMDDVSKWIGREIKIIGSEKYTDIYDVFEKTGWLVGPGGARCTTELKKIPRKKYQRPDDIHVFGFTSEEKHRVARFNEQNPELEAIFPLIEADLNKDDCHDFLRRNGIAQPMMYRLGYKNNNCIGCVKGGVGYWQKIRNDFPEIYWKMAKMERHIGAAINSQVRDGVKYRVYLDELEENKKPKQDLFDFSCGVLCVDEGEESAE